VLTLSESFGDEGKGEEARRMALESIVKKSETGTTSGEGNGYAEGPYKSPYSLVILRVIGEWGRFVSLRK
jgi:hypothetical protein